MKTTNYIILLPPSEGKKEGGDKEYLSVQNINSNNNLNHHREYLYQNLLSYVNNANMDELKKLFFIKKKDLVLQAKELLKNHNKEKTLPSIKRYTGMMFEHLKYQNLETQSKCNAENSILFIDGLLGLLKVTDLVPNYKLSIRAKFLISNKLFTVSKYWKENLIDSFKEIFANKIVLDILPESHREVIDKKIIDGHNRYYKINFYEIKNNVPKNSGHVSKQLKGEFIRYILESNEVNHDLIQKFHHSKGYKYDERFSNKNEIIFLRK